MGKKYYFVFCKEDLLLEKTSTGGYTIPFQEEPPTAVKPWTNLMQTLPEGWQMSGTSLLGSEHEVLWSMWRSDADGYRHL